MKKAFTHQTYESNKDNFAAGDIRPKASDESKNVRLKYFYAYYMSSLLYAAIFGWELAMTA